MQSVRGFRCLLAGGSVVCLLGCTAGEGATCLQGAPDIHATVQQSLHVLSSSLLPLVKERIRKNYAASHHNGQPQT